MNAELKPLKTILHKQYFKYIKYLTLFAFIASVITVLISLHFDRLQSCQSLTNRVSYLNDVFAREMIIGSTDTFQFELNKLKSDYSLDDIHFDKRNHLLNSKCSFMSLNRTVNHPIRFADNILGYVVSTQGPLRFLQLSNLSFFIPLFLIIVFSFIFITSLTRIFQRFFFAPLTNMLEDAELVGVKRSNFKYDGNVEEFDNLKNQLNSMLFRINQVNEINLNLEKAAGIGEVATQVAHDIRSPLEVLKGLKDEISVLPEASRKRVQLSINRIEEITFNLLKSHKRNLGIEEEYSEELLSLVTSVVTEKKIEFRNSSQLVIEEIFTSNSYGLFSKIQRSSLKSVISNLLNNSVESTSGQNARILVSLNSDRFFNYITIADNGLGIHPDVKEKLFTKGFTTKRTGNGLGLHNAKQELEAVGGTIEFESEIGKGTTFTITLPKSEFPSTFISSVDVYNYERIIILDDDPAFHEVWSKRLEGLESKIEHIHSVAEMFSKYQELNTKILLLSDFELMDNHLDGIDTILKLKHSEHSVLVTARNEEQAIQDRCLKAGIKLLPKSLVNYVKVVRESIESAVAIKASPVILIDDDKLVHINWKTYCKRNGLEFTGFASIRDFLNASTDFDKSSRIYIDSNLGDGIKGEIESERIFALGFMNLYLATGYEKDSIEKPTWIKDIYSKSPENIG